MAKRGLTLNHTMLTFNDPRESSLFEKIERKGENDGNQHFSPFPTMFSTLARINFYFLVTFNFEFGKVQNLSFGKGLMHLCINVFYQRIHYSSMDPQ